MYKSESQGIKYIVKYYTVAGCNDYPWRVQRSNAQINCGVTIQASLHTEKKSVIQTAFSVKLGESVTTGSWCGDDVMNILGTLYRVSLKDSSGIKQLYIR
jgi:hypothetical protein